MKSFKSFLNEVVNPVTGAPDEGGTDQSKVTEMPGRGKFPQTPPPDVSYQTDLPGIHVLNHHVKEAQKGSLEGFSRGLKHSVIAAIDVDKKSKLPPGQTTASHGFVKNPMKIEFSDDESADENHAELVKKYKKMLSDPKEAGNVPSLGVMFVPGTGTNPHRIVAHDSHANAVLEALRNTSDHFSKTHPVVIRGQHAEAFQALRRMPSLQKQRRAIPENPAVSKFNVPKY